MGCSCSTRLHAQHWRKAQSDRTNSPCPACVDSSLPSKRRDRPGFWFQFQPCHLLMRLTNPLAARLKGVRRYTMKSWAESQKAFAHQVNVDWHPARLSSDPDSPSRSALACATGSDRSFWCETSISFISRMTAHPSASHAHSMAKGILVGPFERSQGKRMTVVTSFLKRCWSRSPPLPTRPWWLRSTISRT